MLVIPVAIPGSGKSYLSKLAVESGVMPADGLVCLDDLRRVLTGHWSNQWANDEVFSIRKMIVDSRLSAGLSCWLDDTNLGMTEAHRFSGSAKAQKMKVYTILFDTDYDLCFARNAQRDIPVPESVIRKMIKRFESLIEQNDFPGEVLRPWEFCELTGIEY